MSKVFCTQSQSLLSSSSSSLSPKENFALDKLFCKVYHNAIARIIQTVGRRWSHIIEYSVLFLIVLLCFFIREFAVIRYESVIHEFDPYFNFRTTNYLSSEGFYEFWNWFDVCTWYPLGRVIGQTLYPGLMTTSAVLHYLLHLFGLIIKVKDICVFMAPAFSGLTAIAAHLFTKEVTNNSGAGLFSALFVGVSPAYMSRSVAGSYDNEAVAIFALVFSFYVFIKAINTGTMLLAMLASLAFFYMVVSWGGYVFVINTIAVYIVALAALGRLTIRHYVVYSVFYVLATILCLNVPFVNFSAVTSSEHMSSHGCFIMLNAVMFGGYLRRLLQKNSIKFLIQCVVVFCIGGFILLFLILTITGRTAWSGRSMTLLDPTYAAKYIPIIASVSEHQPTTWSAYVFDLHICILLSPIGLWICFKKASDGLLFAGIYGILAVYFSGVMVRLMLVLAPASAILSGIGLSYVVSCLVEFIRLPTALTRAIKGKLCQYSPSSEQRSISITVAVFLVGLLMWICNMYVNHATWTSSLAYSHPSIVLSARLSDGSRMIQDDFREAYYWLRQNTHAQSKIMSWWDYGYQTTAMGNRTVLVDNNTWNNTHIATVGLALASTEEEAYPILFKLDVDYVFVVFGGYARYHSDDINKFLWMVRIASGVYPSIQQSDYLNHQGMYTVGDTASSKLLNSVMYKLCYYNFASSSKGFDYARNYEIGKKDFQLEHFEEAYTTSNWLVRIYKVKRPPNRAFNGMLRNI